MKKLVTAIAILFFFTGCGNKAETEKTEPKPTLSPIKVVVIEDWSQSYRKENKIKLSDLKPLMDKVFKAGGVLAYGRITDHSFEPFLEMNIAEKPLSPDATLDKNPFKRAPKLQQNEANKAYQVALQSWLMESDNAVAKFGNEFDKCQSKATSFTSSDLYGAFERAEQIVCAPNIYQKTPEIWVIVASDMVHDWIGGNQKRFSGFSCPTHPMLIIGAKGAGNIALKEKSFINFQSLQTAILNIK